MISPISKIDITPLVGVALILVIVFMVTSPLMMTPAEMEIELPRARTIEAKSKTNITISISKDGQMALNDETLAQEKLAPALKTMLATHPERVVVIRADKNIRHHLVQDLLSVAKKSGARYLAIATLQRGSESI